MFNKITIIADSNDQNGFMFIDSCIDHRRDKTPVSFDNGKYYVKKIIKHKNGEYTIILVPDLTMI